MFEKDQKVWCAIYGAGVVTKIRQEAEVDYPVVVLFKRNGDENVVTYTNDGKYHDDGNITLFPYPIEIVKAVTKPSIDWSHVSEDFRYLVMDECGQHWLTTNRPTILTAPERWIGSGVAQSAGQFASLIPGTCNWKDSLVKRPN